MTNEERWDRLVDDAWLRGGRAFLLASAIALLAWTQQHFEYPIWKLGLAAFAMALPRRTFPLIIFVLAVMVLLALFPPGAASSVLDFVFRARG